MKPFLQAACVATITLLGATGQAQAEAFPAKQILLMVPFSPGSGADLIARAFVPGLSDDLKVPVVVENREGAAGLIGLMDAARAANDGYTIVMSAEPPLSLAPMFQDRKTYDPLAAFTPITRVGAVPMVLVASPQSGVKSVADLRQYVATHADQANYASNGNASPAQVMMELFKAASGIPVPEVTYKSTTQMTTDVAGGHVLTTFLSVGSGAPLARFPGVPTLAQALGKPDYRADVAYEFLAPAGTPDDRVQRIYAAMAKAFATPQTQTSLKQLSVIPDLKTPAELAKILKQDSINAHQVYDALQSAKARKN